MRQIERDFASLGANGSSAAITASELREKTVQVFGTFAATAQVEGSIDGTNFVAIGASVTAGALIEVPSTVKNLRITVSGYSSGTVESKLAALEARTDV